MKSGAGFTIIEIVLAMGILALIFGVGAPLLADAYRDIALRTEHKRFVNLLRRAERYAFSNHAASSYGLRILDDSFVFFRGSSYADRNAAFDEIYARSDTILFSGPSEIVFFAPTGLPSGAASWDLFQGDTEIASVVLNEYGRITW
ncbi:MAG: hypothetical protein Q8R20_01055 [Nanoarchaeota archaeon]|nr:hypothetical protein [Nanoarchaeota archaeon]